MKDFWWFIHIVGISIWFGVITAGLLVFPSRKSLINQIPSQLDIRTLVLLLTRMSNIGAGLTAIGGTFLSLLIQPKSELSAFWLTTMQGLGVIAFFLSVIVLTRSGKRLLRFNSFSVDALNYLQRYRIWLFVVFILLLISFIMAAFKPIL